MFEQIQLDEYLKELWDNRDKLIGTDATVKYFELTSAGVPRFPKVICVDRGGLWIIN